MALYRLSELKNHLREKGWTVKQLGATARVKPAVCRDAVRGQSVTAAVARRISGALEVPVEILAGQKTFLDLNI